MVLLKLVQRKAAGKKIEPAAPSAKPDNVINLMDAPRHSVGGAKPHGRSRTGRRPPRHTAHQRKPTAA
jgi:non-homologous end joining protein Ku